jgi:hypothetical protein
MRYALVTLLAAASSVALAQNRPQLTWEGYVSGSAVLHIQGDRVDVQGRDTGSVERPRVQLNAPLPAARQTIQMDVRRGRGRVNVVEQPTPRNEFTATVRIDPVGTQHELYRIDFFWDEYAGGNRRQGGWNQSRRRDRQADDYGYRGRQRDEYGYSDGGEMTWSGSVDQEAIIEIRGRRANVRTLRGREVYGARVDFSEPLPRNAADLRLEQIGGRGVIELVEQPHSGNNYSAVVRVFDSAAGADQYAFRLVWGSEGGAYSSSGGYNSSGGVLSPSGGGYSDPVYGGGSTGVYGSGMRWVGRVDGTVRVSVRGDRAWTTRVSGGPVYGENASFGGVLPRANVDAEVRKLRGRGDVDIVQRPSSQNGYTLIFEIEDDDAGQDDYEIEVTWR